MRHVPHPRSGAQLALARGLVELAIVERELRQRTAARDHLLAKTGYTVTSGG
jgi:hypothetical protein